MKETLRLKNFRNVHRDASFNSRINYKIIPLKAIILKGAYSNYIFLYANYPF